MNKDINLKDLWRVWMARSINNKIDVRLFSNSNYNYYIPFVYKGIQVQINK